TRADITRAAVLTAKSGATQHSTRRILRRRQSNTWTATRGLQRFGDNPTITYMIMLLARLIEVDEPKGGCHCRPTAARHVLRRFCIAHAAGSRAGRDGQ